MSRSDPFEPFDELWPSFAAARPHAPGSLTLLLGSRRAGKSWLAAKMGTVIANGGASVLLLSLDMPRRFMMNRALDMNNQQSVAKLLFLSMHDVDCVEALERAIVGRDIQVVIVDESWLLVRRSKGPMLTRLRKIIIALKEMALRRNIMVLGLSQVPATIRSGRMSVEESRLSDYADTTISLIAHTSGREKRLIYVRGRECLPAEFAIHFDLENMNFYEDISPLTLLAREAPEE